MLGSLNSNVRNNLLATPLAFRVKRPNVVEQRTAWNSGVVGMLELQ